MLRTLTQQHGLHSLARLREPDLAFFYSESIAETATLLADHPPDLDHSRARRGRRFRHLVLDCIPRIVRSARRGEI